MLNLPLMLPEERKLGFDRSYHGYCTKMRGMLYRHAEECQINPYVQVEQYHLLL